MVMREQKGGERMTNEKNCLLAGVCKFAGDPASCTSRCPFFVNLHGVDGVGSIVGNANIPRDYRMLTLNTSPAKDAHVRIRKDDDKNKIVAPDENNSTIPIGHILNRYVSLFPRQFEEGAEAIRSLYLYSEQPGKRRRLPRWLTSSLFATISARRLAGSSR